MTADEHLVEIYENDSTFIGHLAGYTAAGLAKEEAVLLMITPSHRAGLEACLKALGWNAEGVRARGRLLMRDAGRVLDAVTRRGWPEEGLFRAHIGGLLKAATQQGRGVRAFGEAGTLLWNDRHRSPGLRLEKLCDELCHEAGFPLYCAYPRHIFVADPACSIRKVRGLHSKHLPSRH